MLFSEEDKNIHLSEGICPNCTAPGIMFTLSLTGMDLESETNFIIFDREESKWLCSECWLK